MDGNNSDDECAPSVKMARDRFRAYLNENSDVVQELAELRRKGWQDEETHRKFQKERERSKAADDEAKRQFLNMNARILQHMDAETNILSILNEVVGRAPLVLDLGMAPGGFSMAVLWRNNTANIRGISLPSSQGGHEIMLRKDTCKGVRIKFLDVTMLAAEMGVADIPPSHPDAAAFSAERPFLNDQFDLAFCGAQVLHTQPRLDYRQLCERSRLRTSQLVLAMQRLRPGGTLMILLNRADSWDTARILADIDKFSDSLTLFKPHPKPYAKRSAFYAVARGVNPDCAAAKSAVEKWKREWRAATLEGIEALKEVDAVTPEEVDKFIAEFGPRVLELGARVWRIQADALKKMTG